MCIAWLKRLFKKEPEETSPEETSLEEKRWESPKWFKRIFRLVDTSRGYWNMPKFQTCPGCGRQAKRAYKTSRGAVYKCRCGSIKSVTHPEVQRAEMMESLRRKKWQEPQKKEKKKPLAASAAKK